MADTQKGSNVPQIKKDASERTTSAKKRAYKVSKLMLWPGRTINLGNYSTVHLNAGIEVTFDKPVDLNSQSVKNAQAEMRKIIRDEFKEQFAPYIKKTTPKTEVGK